MFVVRWNRVPRRPRPRCRAKAFLVSRDVLVPTVALVEVAGIELPVLPRLVDALEESFALLGLRDVEPELEYHGALLRKITLVVGDRSQPLGPELRGRLVR